VTSEVVGIFPNDSSAIRLAGVLLIEQNDEWLLLVGGVDCPGPRGQGNEAREEAGAESRVKETDRLHRYRLLDSRRATRA
jgi:hypothetical protein